jgi:hypothetical protein
LSPGPLIAAILVIVSPGGRAQDGRSLAGDLDLRWEAPPECPTADAIEARTVAELPPGTRASTRVRAIGRVEESASGEWRLHLQLESAAGRLTPETSAADCDELADAAAVQIAMALEPVPIEPEPVAAPEPEPVERVEPAAEPAPEAPPPADDPPTATPSATPRPRVTGALSSGGGVGVGIVPDLDAWLLLSGAVLVALPTRAFSSQARAEMLVAYALPRTRAATDGTAAGIRVSAWSIGPRGCWEPRVASVQRTSATFSFPLCLGADVLAVTGRGEGVRRSYRATRAAVAVVGGAHLIWHPLARLGVRAGVESWVTAVRPAFDIDDSPPLYTVGQFGIRGLFALQASLP